MTLKEIRAQVEDAETKRQGETPPEYAQRSWDNSPRIAYPDLPASLQKKVRERHTLPNILDFLRECYIDADFEETVKSMSAEDQAKLPQPADSYISFETITAGISDADLQTILLRTRNTAVYTIGREATIHAADGETITGDLIPFLHGNHATDAFEAAIAEHENAPKTEDGKKRRRSEARAAANGQLVSAGFYQYLASDKSFQHSLTPQKNKNAYIALMTPEFFDKLDFSDGVLSFDNESDAYIKKYRRGKYEDIQDLDLPLLQQIYTAASKAYAKNGGYTITVYFSKFLSEMNIDPRKQNAAEIMRKLHSFENCVGVMPGTGIIAKLFSIIEINSADNTMTFAVPYIFRLIDELERKNKIEGKTKKGELYEYEAPYNNRLVHSAIANERNKTAVELVYLITTGLLQRGKTPDAKTWAREKAKMADPALVSYSISFRTLINDAPLLRGRIKSYKSQNDKNKALRRAFEKAYQLIKAKTDAGEYFIDLHIPEIIPTMSTLDDLLTITHHGINGDYKPRR